LICTTIKYFFFLKGFSEHVALQMGVGFYLVTRCVILPTNKFLNNFYNFLYTLLFIAYIYNTKILYKMYYKILV